MVVLLLVLGLVALVGGAEILVRGASAIAVRTGLSPVVVGLTVVAFGTSTPELAVSVGAARGDQAGLAVGNVVGSNIFNILAVLGLSAAIGGGLVVAQKIVRIDVPIMIAASVAVLLMSLNGVVGRLEGTVLFAALLVYVVWTVRAARREAAEVAAEYEEAFGGSPAGRWARDVAFVVGGVVLLVVGAQWLVDSASDIAGSLGVSELVIGLTVVAAGTSAPELATSVVAAVKGERDIAVGNAVGSNIFNLLAVLGLSAVVAPGGLPVSDDALRLDMPVMLAVAVACLPVFFNGFELKRWEGALFALYYVAYVTFLVLDQTGSGLRDPFAVVMLGFVVPLTVITLVVVTVRVVRARRSPPGASEGRPPDPPAPPGRG
jgi:cation:H+ antiporter